MEGYRARRGRNISCRLERKSRRNVTNFGANQTASCDPPPMQHPAGRVDGEKTTIQATPPTCLPFLFGTCAPLSGVPADSGNARRWQQRRVFLLHGHTGQDTRVPHLRRLHSQEVCRTTTHSRASPWKERLLAHGIRDCQGH